MGTLLSNPRESYIIPPYHRSFSWTKHEWEALFQDIRALSHSSKHFLGMIIVAPNGQYKFGLNTFQIVDGQQRLVTILIWLICFRDKFKEDNRNDLVNYINEKLLFAKDYHLGKEIDIPKLQLGKFDNQIVIEMLYGTNIDFKHVIVDCYNYFKERAFDERLFKKILKNTYVIHVNTSSMVNDFNLFNTLNNRGLKLSQIDLVRNTFLLRTSLNQQIFAKTNILWNRISDKIKDEELVNFLQIYFLSTLNIKLSSSKLYKEVKNIFNKADPYRILIYLKDMVNKASTYQKIIELSFKSKKINEALYSLQLIGARPSYPLLLSIFPYYENHFIKEEEILYILKMVEILHVRWWICGFPHSQLMKTYNKVCKNLKKMKSSKIASLTNEIFSNDLIRFVDDQTFRIKFINFNFPSSKKKTKYILWKLSNPTGETSLNINNIETEHIMPVSLNFEWEENLTAIKGMTSKKVKLHHKNLSNRIGNLTIIKDSSNRSMSQKKFCDKKRYYLKSEFSLSRGLKNYSNWGFNEIIQRTNNFVELALKIWKWRRLKQILPKST